MIMQMNDPNFPNPKNRWQTGGYPATQSFLLEEEQMAEFMLDNPEIFGDTQDTVDEHVPMAEQEKTAHAKAKSFLNAPKDEMDEMPLTHFFGQFFSEALRLLSHPQLFRTESARSEFMEF
jgi:hypothetical protein